MALGRNLLFFLVGASVALASTISPSVQPAEAVEVPTVVINEVESSGGTPGDWVEIKNLTSQAFDASGYVVKDNDDSHVFTVPAATTIPADGYIALDVDPVFGLGAADSARLFAPDGVTIVDQYSWTSHAATTYGRCPDGTGSFAITSSSTKGTANDCTATEPPVGPVAQPWPGNSEVVTVDESGLFGGNMSGLAYEPSGKATPGTMWAVKNGVGTLYRLLWDGTRWVPADAGWETGRVLHYSDGTGDVDAEGVALTDAGESGGIFVSTERNNSVSSVSRPSVLRYNVTAGNSALNATSEWNLAADLPAIAPNSGLEAIEWIADADLVKKGFVDQSTGKPYDPASYANHGNGLFFVGLEANGMVYAYALDQSGSAFHRVASFASGFPGVMDLEYDAERQALWVVCDDTCNGQTATFDVASTGANKGSFTATSLYERPTGMANLNNEGFAMAPQELCVNGTKPVYYADDNNTGLHALRAGSIDCTTKPVEPVEPVDPVDPVDPTPTPTPTPTPSTDPVAPSVDKLAETARGSVSSPATARPGETITLTVGMASTSQIVDVWMYSTPTHVAHEAVSATGSVRVTIPQNASIGQHRLAVTSASGALIGWDNIEIVAASGSLASTGSETDGYLAVAVPLIMLGLGFVVAHRRAAKAYRKL